MRFSRFAACLFLLLLVSACAVAGEAPAESSPAGGMPIPFKTDGSEEPENGKPTLEGTLLKTFEQGGFMMWPILVTSVIGLAISFERLFGLRKRSILPKATFPMVKTALETEGVASAIGVCDSRPSPLGRVLRAGLECYTALAPTGVSASDIDSAMSESMADVAQQELWKMRNPTKRIGFIANVAPLMGLLGTVFGMIRLFKVIGERGAVGNVEQLSGGIAEALLTTAAGLAIAIPFLFIYEYFRSKAERNIHTIAAMATELTRTVIVLASKRARPAQKPQRETADATSC